jgi:hypothetical protein
MDGKVSPNLLNNTPHYGTKGVADTANTPAGRSGFGKWKDLNGNYWIYGGFQYEVGLNVERTKGDMWKYIPDLQCALITTTNEMDASADNLLLVYPNPTNSAINISYLNASSQYLEIKIIDLVGNEIYFSNEKSTMHEFRKAIDVKNFNNGVYVVVVKSKNTMSYQKFVVQH